MSERRTGSSSQRTARQLIELIYPSSDRGGGAYLVVLGSMLPNIVLVDAWFDDGPYSSRTGRLEVGLQWQTRHSLNRWRRHGWIRDSGGQRQPFKRRVFRRRDAEREIASYSVIAVLQDTYGNLVDLESAGIPPRHIAQGVDLEQLLEQLELTGNIQRSR